MATAKQTGNAAKDAKNLAGAVKSEVKSAQNDASTGNVATVKETSAQPAESLPTGQRRGHPAE